jgi:hypothetical protein
VTFQREARVDCLLELKQLFPLHYEEIALFRDRIKLNPLWSGYEQIDLAGKLHIFTAREGAQLVGYHISTLMPHPHYADHLMLFTDIFFMKQESRKGLAGLRFLQAIKNYAKSVGAEHLVMGTKLHKDLAILFERLGGVPTDMLFAFPLV